MDNESVTDEPAPLWPEMSSDITSARTVARSITLDTQRASTDGRVLELSSQLQAMNARLLEVETRLATGQSSAAAETDDRTEQLAQEVVDLRSLIGQTSKRLEQQATAPAVESTVSNETLLSLDSRMASVESGRVRDSEEVNQLMSYLEQAFVRLDELSSRLVENEEGLRAQVGAAESQLAAQVGEVRGVLESQVAEVENNLAADVAEAREQLAAQVQQAEERLQANMADLDSGASNEALNALDQRVIDLDSRIGELPGIDVVSAFDNRVDSTDQRLDGVAGRVDELSDQLQGVHGRIDEVANTDELSGRIDHVDNRVNDTHARIDELTGHNDDVAGHIGDLNGRVDHTDGRLGEVDVRVGEVDGRVNEIDGRINDVQARLDDVAAATNTDELTGQLDGMNARVDNAHSRLDEVEAHAGEATAEVAERVAATEERLGQLDAVQEQVAAVQQKADAVDALVDERVDASENRLAERIKEARELLADQQQESQTELAAKLEATEQAMATKVSAIEEELAAQVAEARQLLTEQADDTSTVEALAALEERVQSIDEAANSATSIAIESQHFSENLRVLQTDLVKAIQVELEGQAVRLGELEQANMAATDEQQSTNAALDERITAAEAGNGNTDARLEHLETTIVSLAAKPSGELGLAPANPLDAQRLSAVEARLDETASTESTLSDSITNMVAALEQNTREIQSLRALLDEANGRIAELEGGAGAPPLTFSSGERVEPTEPSPAPAPTPEPEPRSDGGLRVADVIGETTKEERLTPKDGSDWFVASYAKKDKTRGRFRRP